MQTRKTFYLVSTEGPRNGQPWKCESVRRVTWFAKYPRDDGLLVTVFPPILGEYHKNKPIKELVIFPRAEGDSLFPINTLPTPVNICVINTESIKVTGKATDNDLTFCDMGMIGDFDQANDWKYKN